MHFSQKSNLKSNFSEEQLAQMKELKLEYAKNSLEIKNDLKVLTAEYNGMMTGDNQDLNGVSSFGITEDLNIKYNAIHGITNDTANLLVCTMNSLEKIQVSENPIIKTTLSNTPLKITIEEYRKLKEEVKKTLPEYINLINATKATTTNQGVAYLNNPITIANNASNPNTSN